MGDYSISPMTRKDVREVWEIEKMCFPVPWSLRSFELEVTKNQCARYVTAKEENRVVGYGGMWLVLDEAHVTNVAVHPEYRGKGIGEGIMRSLMNTAVDLGIRTMTLEVRVSNQIAQNLYKKMGFEEAGIRKGYYSNNKEDALIMWNHHIEHIK